MRLMLLGAPGAGKGTQASFLCKQFNIKQISTGDMLRLAIRNETALGMEAKKYMDLGQLVPDDVMIGLIKERLNQADLSEGFLLDGFPRTLAQAKALTDANINMDAVVEIFVEDDEIIKRISGRRVHPASGRVYHVDYCPPKTDGLDDETGEPLIVRDDDKEETVKKRLKVYHQQTAPVVSYYKDLEKSDGRTKFFYVSGIGEAKVIAENILEQLSA